MDLINQLMIMVKVSISLMIQMIEAEKIKDIKINITLNYMNPEDSDLFY